MKQIILLLLVLLCNVFVYAQEENTMECKYDREKKELTIEFFNNLSKDVVITHSLEMVGSKGSRIYIGIDKEEMRMDQMYGLDRYINDRRLPFNRIYLVKAHTKAVFKLKIEKRYAKAKKLYFLVELAYNSGSDMKVLEQKFCTTY